VEQWS